MGHNNKKIPHETHATGANGETNLKPTMNEYHERKRKLLELNEMGLIPYAERFERSHLVSEIRNVVAGNSGGREGGMKDLSKKNRFKNFFGKKNSGGVRDLEKILKGPKAEFKICGRIMLMRPHGKLTFAKIKDVSGEMQICFMQDFLESHSKKGSVNGKESYKFLKKIDVGDFIGAEGEFFYTKHGELTLLVQNYWLLSKTLRPLPEKFHGLSDTESKYRYRYLDMVTDQESFDRFVFRSKLISSLRRYLDENNFLEVETPVLTSVASGAAAKPFITHHNALDIEMYLRIAPETYLKRCVAGGMERVYEFARCFRNEGMDPSHLQEFNMLEWYSAYWNYEDNMAFTEKLISHAILELKGTTKITLRDREGVDRVIDFQTPWPRISFVDLIEKDCGINILDFYGDTKKLLAAIRKKSIEIEKAETMGYGNLCDALYKKVSRPKLIQPCFVIKHPVDTKPLARKNDTDGRIADTFQLLVNTWEIVNAYSELVDPVDQRERLVRQADAKEGGDEDAMPMDEDFLLAMEHGMPPISGFGMGIDRLCALLTNQDNLKDTVLFPILRPEN